MCFINCVSNQNTLQSIYPLFPCTFKYEHKISIPLFPSATPRTSFRQLYFFSPTVFPFANHIFFHHRYYLSPRYFLPPTVFPFAQFRQPFSNRFPSANRFSFCQPFSNRQPYFLSPTVFPSANRFPSTNRFSFCQLPTANRQPYFHSPPGGSNFQIGIAQQFPRFPPGIKQ